MSDAERSAMMYRRAIDGWEALGLPLRQARALFELLELLYINDLFGEAEKESEIFRELLLAHEHVRQYFTGLRGELEELSNKTKPNNICMDYVQPKLDVLNLLYVQHQSVK